MSAALSGLAGGLSVVAITYFVRRSKARARLSADGWYQLRPGWILYFLIALVAALLTILLVALINFDPSRADAEAQIRALYGLIAGSSAGLVFFLWHGFGRKVDWKDGQIRVRSLFGSDTSYDFADANQLKDDGLGLTIKFADGRKLGLTTLLRGSRDMAKAMKAEYEARRRNQ